MRGPIDVKQEAEVKKTVLILGAGASCEVGLPVGEQLMDSIAKLLDIRYDGYDLVAGDPLIAQALRACARLQEPPSRDLNELIRAAHNIKNAMAQSQSIDNYLDAHRGQYRCGIVREARDRSGHLGRRKRQQSLQRRWG